VFQHFVGLLASLILFTTGPTQGCAPASLAAGLEYPACFGAEENSPRMTRTDAG